MLLLCISSKTSSILCCIPWLRMVPHKMYIISPNASATSTKSHFLQPLGIPRSPQPLVKSLRSIRLSLQWLQLACIYSEFQRCRGISPHDLIAFSFVDFIYLKESKFVRYGKHNNGSLDFCWGLCNYLSNLSISLAIAKDLALHKIHYRSGGIQVALLIVITLVRSLCF